MKRGLGVNGERENIKKERQYKFGGFRKVISGSGHPITFRFLKES